VFSKALAKSPSDRYRTCVEFADALATQLGIVADKTGADDDTAVAIPTSGSRHRRPERASKEPTKTQMRILVALLVTVSIIALILLVLHLI